MTRRIEFTVPDDVGEAYDKARGIAPMATWIKAVLAEQLNGWALESALGSTPGKAVAVSSPTRNRRDKESAAATSAPTRAPGDPAAVKAKREAPPDRRVKGSTEARPFRPIPKAGKR